MIQLLRRPRYFVLAFWVASMLFSALVGGLMLSFDPGTLLIWLILTLLFPALVVGFVQLESRVGAPTAIRETAGTANARSRPIRSVRTAPRRNTAQTTRSLHRTPS